MGLQEAIYWQSAPLLRGQEHVAIWAWRHATQLPGYNLECEYCNKLTTILELAILYFQAVNACTSYMLYKRLIIIAFWKNIKPDTLKEFDWRNLHYIHLLLVLDSTLYNHRKTQIRLTQTKKCHSLKSKNTFYTVQKHWVVKYKLHLFRCLLISGACVTACLCVVFAC